MADTCGTDITGGPFATTTSAIVAAATATPAIASPANDEAEELKFDPSIPDDEKNFYLKAYSNVDLVRERKVHCTVCKAHIGTAPAVESVIKMHPILRVTHCTKCHDFYNSGEFSKGEDGSELYCRWCGQGGEVYCCSSCPYVFCKSCITKNLSRGVVADIEQNENWNCFNCATKILWPLRAQHWALVNFIQQQKNHIKASNLSESETKRLMAEDRSTCCRLAKAKCGNMSDSLESIDSVNSRRSVHSNGSISKKIHKLAAPTGLSPPAKRQKTNNDEVVCTPDLLSMLEPDCQITETPKTGRPVASTPTNSAPRIMTIQTSAATASSTSLTPRTSAPPPLVLRNTSIKINPVVAPQPVVRRTVIGPRAPTPTGGTAPVYHTINGYRIDLNSAAQHETFRLPNGKLIQVKRQGVMQQQTQQHQATPSTPPSAPSGMPTVASGAAWSRVVTAVRQPHQQQQLQQQQQTQQNPPPARPIQITQTPTGQTHYQQITITPQQQHPQVIRYHNTVMANRQAALNGATHVQVLNGTVTPTAPVQQTNSPNLNISRPQLIRHIFPETPIGQARSQLQDQVFNAMEICLHLTSKIQTLTNSNAYKQARTYLEVKELYIHLSYLLTYAIGRFKGLQDKCLADMRQLGFVNDADCLENGQLAAGADYVAYGQLDDVDLFNTCSNSFHNQVYEYRKSLHSNLKDGDAEPLPPLFPIGIPKKSEIEDDDCMDDGGNSVDDGHDIKTFTKIKLKAEPFDETEDTSDMKDLPAEDLDDNDEQDDTQNDDDDAYAANTMSTNDFSTLDESTVNDSSNAATQNDFNNPYEELHAFDRKLTRLIQPYPSIWCTRHPDYGNFEITRKHWRTIASHFKRNDNIKLRWKNIRKRYVRIEKRMQEGKRFHGYFDKATNFLVNRDLPEDEWIEVDCGEEDGDVYDRKQLDVIEGKIHKNFGGRKLANSNKTAEAPLDPLVSGADGFANAGASVSGNAAANGNNALKPIDIHPLDVKIINFVKSHPVLWNKSKDPMCNRIDEQTRSSLWAYLGKSTKVYRNGSYITLDYRCEDLIDRWAHLYEMYKTFRLKTIKNEAVFANLELKYSKYLAKLYFLYKIDESDLHNEHQFCEDDLLSNDENAQSNDKENQRGNINNANENENEIAQTDDERNGETTLQEMPDDKEFSAQLVRAVQQYEVLWNKKHEDYNDLVLRNNYWLEIDAQLHEFKHKQASDDEDNEIEIVEPKTDTITLDSDIEDEMPSPTPTKSETQAQIQNPNNAVQQKQLKTYQLPQQQQQILKLEPGKQQKPETPSVTSASSAAIAITAATSTTGKVSADAANQFPENVDFMSAAQSFLASMLEVEITEGDHSMSQTSPGGKSKKQPRKKTTNKPNPQLLELERQRLEELKNNDVKLKMKCYVNLKKVEEEYPVVKKLMTVKEKMALVEQRKPREHLKTQKRFLSTDEKKSETKRKSPKTYLKMRKQMKVAVEKENNKEKEKVSEMEVDKDKDNKIELVIIAKTENSVESIVEINDDNNEQENPNETQKETEEEKIVEIEVPVQMEIEVDKEKTKNKLNVEKDSDEIVCVESAVNNEENKRDTEKPIETILEKRCTLEKSIDETSAEVNKEQNEAEPEDKRKTEMEIAVDAESNKEKKELEADSHQEQKETENSKEWKTENNKERKEAEIETENNKEIKEAETETETENNKEIKEAETETENSKEMKKAEIETENNKEIKEAETENNKEMKEAEIETENNKEIKEAEIETETENNKERKEAETENNKVERKTENNKEERETEADNSKEQVETATENDEYDKETENKETENEEKTEMKIAIVKEIENTNEKTDKTDKEQPESNKIDNDKIVIDSDRGKNATMTHVEKSEKTIINNTDCDVEMLDEKLEEETKPTKIINKKQEAKENESITSNKSLIEINNDNAAADETEDVDIDVEKEIAKVLQKTKNLIETNEHNAEPSCLQKTNTNDENDKQKKTIETAGTEDIVNAVQTPTTGCEKDLAIDAPTQSTVEAQLRVKTIDELTKENNVTTDA